VSSSLAALPDLSGRVTFTCFQTVPHEQGCIEDGRIESIESLNPLSHLIIDHHVRIDRGRALN
jgi:hypothetical protein